MNFLMYKNLPAINLDKLMSVTWPILSSSSSRGPRNIMFKMDNNSMITWTVPPEEYFKVSDYIRVRLSGADKTLAKVREDISGSPEPIGKLSAAPEPVNQNQNETDALMKRMEDLMLRMVDQQSNRPRQPNTNTNTNTKRGPKRPPHDEQ